MTAKQATTVSRHFDRYNKIARITRQASDKDIIDLYSRAKWIEEGGAKLDTWTLEHDVVCV